MSSTWRPRGACVGWILGDELYLDGPAAYRAAQHMADDAGRLGVSQSMLGRRLAERGCLCSQDEKRRKCTIRKNVQGVRHDVLHIRISLLLAQAPSAPSALDADGERAEADSGPDNGAGAPMADPARDRPRDDPPPDSGPVGPTGPVFSTDSTCSLSDKGPRSTQRTAFDEREYDHA